MFFSGRALKYLIFLLVFLFSLILIQNAYLQPPPPTLPTYTVSAHGNTSYGVNRKATSVEEGFGYSIGNCAHCHEQHASIGGAEPVPDGGNPSKYELFRSLFADQVDSFCMACHRDPADTNQRQYSMVPQYNYSRMAGGDTDASCISIRDLFDFIASDCSDNKNNACNNPAYDDGSAHCLNDIQTYLRNKWNFGNTGGDINPCSGCHNPHRAQRDPHTSPGRFVGERLVSSVSMPSQHSKDNNVWQLWGDDGAERMSAYTSTYQAPCRYPWSNPCTSFEPDGSFTTNGSNLVDSVTFCLDCHQYNLPSTRIANPLYTEKPPRQLAGTTNIINWGASGDQHGQRLGDGYGSLYPMLAPYTLGDSWNYVLSCLDCHEPHGSPNEFLLRQSVNGKSAFTGPPPYGGNYTDFCAACHIWPHPTGGGCRTCHYHGSEF